MENLFFDQLRAGWANYQNHLLTALSPLTDEQLDIQLAPNLFSVRLLFAHIVAARVYWFHAVMREGPAEIEPLRRWDEAGQPVRNAAELRWGLEQTWTLVEDGLQRWMAIDMDVMFTRPNNLQTVSRQWVIWHVLEHDLHHGGELSFALGTRGVPAINL